MTDFTLEYSLLTIALIGIWILTAIIVFSYSRLESYIRYVNAVLLFPVTATVVFISIFLASELFVHMVDWMVLDRRSLLAMLLGSLLVTMITTPVLIFFFIGWFRLIRYLDKKSLS